MYSREGICKSNECLCLQKSERPGVFVGILRAGLGHFLHQATAMVDRHTDTQKVLQRCLLLGWLCCLVTKHTQHLWPLHRTLHSEAFKLLLYNQSDVCPKALVIQASYPHLHMNASKA